MRLVKGAYVEPTGAHPYGEATDIACLRLAFRLAEAGAAWSLATHDARLREAVLLALRSYAGGATARADAEVARAEALSPGAIASGQEDDSGRGLVASGERTWRARCDSSS